jgi:rhamnulokinase
MTAFMTALDDLGRRFRRGALNTRQDEMKKHYLAVDLGASSGRTMVGTLNGSKLSLKEMNRFWNGPTEINGLLQWDFVHLFRNIQEGIGLARKEYGDGLASMGVDTWGVDFGLLDADGRLMGGPVHYRDGRTVGMFDQVFKKVPKHEVFANTGIQFMELNTLYQMMALSRSESAQYQSAHKLLFVADLLNYWLTGEMRAERTIASTSQFYNPVKKSWATGLLEKLKIRTDLFAELVDPGTVIGDAQGLPVVAVGSHDTASAFAAVPVAEGEECAFLSSGTWSLLGTELNEPVINEGALAANFTNEVGVCDTIRFLKNLSGLWILQELRRVWNEEGYDYSWKCMDQLADEAEPLQYFFDPSAPEFAVPGNMEKRIQEACEKNGQGCPEDHGAIIRATYENLAMLYADTYETLETLSGKTLGTLRIVGGGSNNLALNQFTANATGRKVIAGPAEATAIGNIVTQMLAMGGIQSLEEGRAIIRTSFAEEIRAFTPQETSAWQSALGTWRECCR